jgi:hypothetical protein
LELIFKSICLGVYIGKAKYTEVGRRRGTMENKHITFSDSYKKETFKYLGS